MWCIPHYGISGLAVSSSPDPYSVTTIQGPALDYLACRSFPMTLSKKEVSKIWGCYVCHGPRGNSQPTTLFFLLYYLLRRGAFVAIPPSPPCQEPARAGGLPVRPRKRERLTDIGCGVPETQTPRNTCYPMASSYLCLSASHSPPRKLSDEIRNKTTGRAFWLISLLLLKMPTPLFSISTLFRKKEILKLSSKRKRCRVRIYL